MPTHPDREGWPPAPVIYQIYPRSFRDSTGTGVGDLVGVRQKLVHVAGLGVDAIWLSPFYPSPMADGGYDISDHRDVHPAFGTIADFDDLVAHAHDLGLKVIVDQVFNHTSTEHPWFQRALMGDEAYADYYVWGDPKPDGTAPNNWLSQFGPPAWTWSHRRRQYFFHNFTSQQPSLNLRNEHVREELRAVMEFWHDRGVDGFRIDAVTSLLFDPSLRDNPPASPEVQAKVTGESFVPYTWQDHVHDILPGDGLEIAETVRGWAGDDVFVMGEVTSGNQSVELACRLAGPDRLDAAYTTDLPEAGCTAEAYADCLERAADPARLGWWLSSHDQPRHAGKSGDGSDHDAKFLALLLTVSPGPVILYQGEELGLSQPTLARHDVTDPLDLLYWPDGPGREGARVPIPWDEGAERGFTIGRPWLPMDWPPGSSVAVQTLGADSVLSFYRAAIAFRRDRLRGRDLSDWSRDGEVVTLFYDGARVVLNFGPEAVKHGRGGEPVFASAPVDGGELPCRTGAVWID
jgi:alpha-glucosidase